jgi:nicotinamide phosphoribosyltransferase
MASTLPIICTDFYKETHYEQLPKNLTKVVSYFTPRMSRVNDNKLVMFGLQYFIKKYMIEDFNENFFGKPIEEVMARYERMIKCTLGEHFADSTRWRKLYNLGYLPLEIRAIPEGERVDMKVPMIQITNTHPDFAWLVNYFETAMSATLWHMMACANVGYKYRQIVDEYYGRTVDDFIPRNTAIGDFSMRGQESVESATTSSAAFLLSFVNTATIPAIEFLEEYYDANVEGEVVGRGLASTEHAVMCSNFAVDGDEKTHILRLLRDIYPTENFSMVSDSYDLWNLVSNIMAEPDVKEAVLEHKGFIGIRPDSGTPEEIICGNEYFRGDSPESIGVVETLWNIYGGTVNSKGYKVLDKHIKVVYGDSITPERAKEIYRRLEKNGFAANNVSLGMGSYSLQSAENNTPLTRDTYSIAVKSTWGELSDGTCINIYKDPKTDNGRFKKSQKGCCRVFKTEDGYGYEDGLTYEQSCVANELKVVYRDGKLKKEFCLEEVRDNLHRKF